MTFQGDAGVAKTESRLQRIANAAYGRGDGPKPPRDLDATAIFRKWNQPPARTLNDDKA
ncbi:hypothetical protein BF49_0280 [Bradyrhizobium sp.]|nr:hypothetical protein BF49_0280 [Bradyrhizobium sp.]